MKLIFEFEGSKRSGGGYDTLCQGDGLVSKVKDKDDTAFDCGDQYFRTYWVRNRYLTFWDMPRLYMDM